MEKENLEKELELIDLKLDLASLETTKYIHDFEKIKEIIGEDENSEENINEKESETENKNKEDDNMEVDNFELDQINENKEFKKIYKSHSNFTEESINNTFTNEPIINIKPDPKVEISTTGDIKNIFDAEIKIENLQEAVNHLNNIGVEYNLKSKEE